ncbi:MAG: hypothetical protein VX958_08775 [Planctomycetota bacterium]|nr:hypothetical protein [Planctomycetota bacterium]
MAKNSEEIIERKEGSPVATSCLVIACVAILGAISLQIAEITQVRADWSLEEKNLNRVLHVEEDLDAITSKIDGILEKSKVGDGEKAKAIIEEGDKKVEKAKAVASGEEIVEEESDSKDDEAPEKDDTEEAEAPDKEDDASDDSELEDF